MKNGLPPLIKSLVRFLKSQISEHRLHTIVPLESKGALLTDVALEHLPPETRPHVCYLRGLEYLPEEALRSHSFGVFDDCAFSGRTLGRARDHMRQLGVPDSQIHLMAFFKFQDGTTSPDELTEVLARTAVPTDSLLLRLSRDEILREVQQLAIANKIPASYDNLEWDVRATPDEYHALMHDLAHTRGFLYYGARASTDASALVLPQARLSRVSVPSKIRLWYDEARSLLRVSPLFFPKGQRRATTPLVEASIEALLTPETPSARQRSFALLQAEALRQQVALLGYLRPYLRQHGLVAALNKKQIDRYYGARSQQVATWIDAAFDAVPDRSIPVDAIGARRVDFHWVALDLMRRLGQMYWSQTPPRRVSRGMTVAEILSTFEATASQESVHAAIDYCADANLIATFFGWKGDGAFRAFRLTENGEREVGRGDGNSRRSLTFVEKLGATILYKSKGKSAPWWVLEKVPAILIRRLGYQLAQMEATVGFFGDMTKLRLRETGDHFLTWPQMRTDLWTHESVRGRGRNGNERRFRLELKKFEEFKDDIFSDPEIIRTLGSIETVLALVGSSKTRGHHLAIVLDILGDRCGGATYLAHAAAKATDLIEHRSRLAHRTDRAAASKEISDWLAGLQEKAALLKGTRRNVLIRNAERVADRLKRQGRGDLAEQLLRQQPFPDGSGIIESFERLCAFAKRLDVSAQLTDAETCERRCAEIASTLGSPLEGDDAGPEAVHYASAGIRRWATALSGEVQTPDVYLNARLNVPVGHERRLFIVAYDLIGSSTKRYAGRSGSERDRYIQSIISNWFIAFGGNAQRAEFGGGDLGFGFFDRLDTAIRASLWATHHLSLLKLTNPTLAQEGPHAGFGIVQDVVRAGFTHQVHSEWLSRFAKAWKREAERIADATGRDGSPIVAIHADMFSDAQFLPPEWFGRVTTLDGIPVRFVSPAARSVIPWET